MSDAKDEKTGVVARIRLWLRRSVIDDVQPELAACEFQCRVQECLQGHWEQCENRLRAERDAQG